MIIPKCCISIILFLIGSNVLAATCFNPKKECVEEFGTRYIGNTLDYCKYRAIQECKETSDSNCQQLIEQKCCQVEANRRALWDGQDLNEKEILSCLNERCNAAIAIACGKKLFFIENSGFVAIPANSQDFNKAATFFILEAAAKEVREKQILDPDAPLIFTGASVECSINIDTAKNCCAGPESWIQEIIGCADDEKELAKAKEAGLVVKAGNGNNEYCHTKIPLGICISHHKVYCVFGSKMARIVQQEGRKKQLGISFGEDAEQYLYSDCRGISINELKHIDFSKINFSELYADWPEFCHDI